MGTTRFLDKLLERVDRVDRRQLEDYLKGLATENAFFRQAIDRLDVGLIILDNNSKVKIINNTAGLLLGISENRLKTKKIFQCPLDPVLLGVLDRAITQRKDRYEQELYVTFPKELLLRLGIYPVGEVVEDEVLGWIVTVQDITEFRRTSSQRFQTEKLKALVTMASILAHELGNPLNSLSIHLELIDRALRGMPERYKGKIQKFCGIARAEVKRLDDIVTRFLQATRPLKPRFLEGDIHKVLDDTIELLSPELKKNKIIVERDYNSDVPRIYIDHLQMRQAFINIIKNAIEAMTKNGRLVIRTALEDSRIKISFTDNGIGIPEDELDKIFEPYYSTKREGSGLGLVIVHRVIRDHGGTIEVKSKLGRGTTVDIYLPIEPRGPRLLPQAK